MKLPVVIRNEEVKVKEDKNGMPVGPWVSLLVHVCVCWSVPVSVRVSKQSLLNILNYVLK